MELIKKPVILCVDDERVVLISVSNQIRNQFQDHFLIETAENTEEAWEVIRELQEQNLEIRFIISDWLMPLDKGDKFLIDVFQELPNASLIMLSGHADEEAVERARKFANLKSFIRKPWDKEELLKVITEGVQTPV